MSLELISSPEAVTPEWMTQVLRSSGHLGDGAVTSVSHSFIGNGKIGDNAHFSLSYEGNHERAPASVVAKFPAKDERARMMAGAQGAYYREVMFYRQLADKTAMRTPFIFANDISDDRALFMTVMEDMSPAVTGDQVIGESRERAVLAMSEAAKLAVAFYGDTSIADNDYVMSAARHDGGVMGQQLLRQHWDGFLQRFGAGLSEECIRFGEHYIDHHTDFVMRDSGPKTLVHGDFRSENILFGENLACTVDWQTYSESSPLTDLAYFMGGSVTTENRRAWERELVIEYAGLLRVGGVQLEDDACWDMYREQAMHGLMITILGASFSSPDERGEIMFQAMIQRHLQHCVDLDAGAFL